MPCGCASASGTTDAPPTAGDTTATGTLSGYFCPKCFWFWFFVGVLALLFIVGGKK